MCKQVHIFSAIFLVVASNSVIAEESSETRVHDDTYQVSEQPKRDVAPDNRKSVKGDGKGFKGTDEELQAIKK